MMCVLFFLKMQSNHALTLTLTKILKTPKPKVPKAPSLYLYEQRPQK